MEEEEVAESIPFMAHPPESSVVGGRIRVSQSVRGVGGGGNGILLSGE